MADLRVTCVNKQPRQNTHKGITRLGGPGWYATQQRFIDAINAGVDIYYTLVDGKRANVRVVNGSTGQYVRTYADGQPTDNLLALVECPQQ